jgi:hypothetical protein
MKLLQHSLGQSHSLLIIVYQKNQITRWYKGLSMTSNGYTLHTADSTFNKEEVRWEATVVTVPGISTKIHKEEANN